MGFQILAVKLVSSMSSYDTLLSLLFFRIQPRRALGLVRIANKTPGIVPCRLHSKEIQEATASEPLTIEEEYEMQRSWRNDEDKLTFISCLPVSKDTENGMIRLKPTHDDVSERMIGDVNLFLKYADEDEGDDEESEKPHTIVGEIELMVAEKRNQRRGFGRASLICFLRYVVVHEKQILKEYISKQTMNGSGKCLGDKFAYLVVRIGATNARSLALFESLGFKRVTEQPNYFGELELRMYGVQKGTVDGLMERHRIMGYEEILYDIGDL